MAAARVKSAADDLAAAREQASRLEVDFHAAEISRREVEVKQESLEEQTLADLELDLGERYPAWVSSPEAAQREPLDRDATRQEIGTLRDSLRKLGHVNLDAIDEEVQLEQQNVELAAQVKDIDNARTQLDALIKDLDQRSRERFEKAFRAIRENFAGHDGMFRKLFGGGSADLILLPDAEGNTDWLESGIETVAVLHSRRGRCRTRPSQRPTVLQRAQAVPGPQPLHRDHPPQAHDAGVRHDLRRHDAGTRRLEAGLGEARTGHCRRHAEARPKRRPPEA